MSQARLAIFLPSLRGGGAERIMVTLANGFAERGYPIDLVLASAEGPYLKDVTSQVRVVDLRAGRVIKSLWPLARYMRRERPSALLSALNHANVVTMLARRVARVPVRLVVSEHSTPSAAASGTQPRRASVVHTAMRWLYPRADAIVAVSNGVADDLARFARLPRDRLTTIYNPIDIARVQQLADTPLDHPWFVPGQPPVVLGIGRLAEPKDFPTLLRAFARLRAVRPARLMILGEGELRDELETLAAELGLSADAVTFPGFVDNPFAYLRRAALFVLSSRWEGLPGVLIEALACGAAVVATDCPSGPAEILEDGRWGRLVPVGDVERLAAAMAEVLSTPPERLPDVAQRALDFAPELAIDAYLSSMKA